MLEIDKKLTWNLYFVEKLISRVLIEINSLTKVLPEAYQFIKINSKRLNLERDGQLLLIEILDVAYGLINIVLKFGDLLIQSIDTGFHFLDMRLLTFKRIMNDFGLICHLVKPCYIFKSSVFPWVSSRDRSLEVVSA